MSQPGEEAGDVGRGLSEAVGHRPLTECLVATEGGELVPGREEAGEQRLLTGVRGVVNRIQGEYKGAL